jgi:Protein of unknown function (DUF3604)
MLQITATEIERSSFSQPGGTYKLMKPRELFLCLTISAFGATAGFAQDIPTPPDASYRSSIPPDQRRAYFGELHIHTAMSFDAWTFGTKVTPDQAYKFAAGQTITIPAAQLSREQGIDGPSAVLAKREFPLDFVAVTDHSEFMGVLNQLDDPNSALARTSFGQRTLKNPGAAFAEKRGAKGSASFFGDYKPDIDVKNAWDIEMKAAADNYRPGQFTTFVAYEWTANSQGKYNLHRNVIFNSDHAPLPFTSGDSNKPEDLWTYLEKTRAHGIDVIAIPHNGNVSGGLMYDWNDSSGRPIDEQYAQRRALNEPLTEIIQNKGQSDTIPALSPNDEFANYEIFDHLISWPDIKSNPNGSFIRQALGRGLVIQSTTGANPYKLGIVAGSDIHNGLSVSSEDAFASGPFGLDARTMLPRGNSAKRALGIVKEPAALDMDAAINHVPPTQERPLLFRPGGLTGVWAEENTRNAIFAALKRKETFATSGTRIRVRMFAGWHFDSKMIDSGDWVAKAYAQGVPMGSDLPARPANSKAPYFILQAVKDPDGANLDRIQIIRLTLDGTAYKEKIFDVALSGRRRANPDTGKAPAVGNTVDLRNGTYKNTIGSAVLTAVWQDPDFDPVKPAVYYARTLEIPTPRWSALLAIKNKLPIPKDAAATVQGRAWTSPIWFTPQKD